MYNAALGRFLQTDPAGDTDSLNLYQYALWDPISLKDPSGRQITAKTQKVTCTTREKPKERQSDGSTTPEPLIAPETEEICLEEVVVTGKVPGPMQKRLEFSFSFLIGTNQHRYGFIMSTAFSAGQAQSGMQLPWMSAPGAGAAKEGVSSQDLWGSNPITQTVNSQAGTINNRTEKGLWFHKGIVDIVTADNIWGGSDVSVAGEGVNTDALIARANEIIGVGFFGLTTGLLATSCALGNYPSGALR